MTTHKQIGGGDEYTTLLPDRDVSNIRTCKLDDLFCESGWHVYVHDNDVHNVKIINRERILHAVELYGQSCGLEYSPLTGLPTELKDELEQLVIDIINKLTHGVVDGSMNSGLPHEERMDYISTLEQHDNGVV